MSRILVVEDDADIASLIVHYLSPAGYDSEVVATGQSTKVEVIDATKSNGHGNVHGAHANGNGNFNFIARTDAPTCPECGSPTPLLNHQT